MAARAWRLERERRGLPAPALGIVAVVGEVVFGTVGHETRLEYTVIGEVGADDTAFLCACSRAGLSAARSDL
jgi:hypothetical protein